MYTVPSNQPPLLQRSRSFDILILISTLVHFLIALYFGFVIYFNIMYGWGWASNRVDYKRDVFLILFIATLNLLLLVKLQRLNNRIYCITLVCLCCILMYLFSMKYTLK